METEDTKWVRRRLFTKAVFLRLGNHSTWISGCFKTMVLKLDCTLELLGGLKKIPILSLVICCCQSLSRVQLFMNPWTTACQASLSFTGVCSNSCSLSQWCHPTISFSVAPLSSCPRSFPPSASFLFFPASFLMSRLFISGGRSIGASASASVLPINIQG